MQELWKEGIFTEYDFCICCKREVAPGESGLVGINPNPAIAPDKPKRSKLCDDCVAEWKEHPTTAISKLPRFKLQ